MDVIIQDKNWTYRDYLELKDEKRYEVINGELIMVPAPSYGHQKSSSNLVRILDHYVYNNKLGEILFAPFDVILDDNTIVQPDILFISKENLENIKERGLFGVPDLVVEIVSPSSLKIDIKDKRQIYEKFSVKEYWLIFPKEKIIEILTLNSLGKYEVFDFTSLEEQPDKTFINSKIFSGLEIDLNNIF